MLKLLLISFTSASRMENRITTRSASSIFLPEPINILPIEDVHAHPTWSCYTLECLVMPRARHTADLSCVYQNLEGGGSTNESAEGDEA